MMRFPWKAVLKLKAATTTKTKLVQKPGPPMLAVKLSLGMSAAAAGEAGIVDDMDK